MRESGEAPGGHGADVRAHGALKILVRRVLDGLGASDFGSRIVVFGASMLLSVIPLIVLLGSFADHRVDVDLSRHLALSPQGARLMSALFKSAPGRVDLAVLVSLVLSFAGAIGVARSVQTGYERVFDRPAARGTRNLAVCCLWIAVTGGLLIADGAVAPHVGRAALADAAYRVAELAALFAFFVWSIHVLLRGTMPWRLGVLPAAVTTVLWAGLRGVAALYFSPTVVSDGHTYGTIGVVLTLLTWFIAIDAVILLGAIVGVALTPRDRVPQ